MRSRIEANKKDFLRAITTLITQDLFLLLDILKCDDLVSEFYTIFFSVHDLDSRNLSILYGVPKPMSSIFLTVRRSVKLVCCFSRGSAVTNYD